MAEKLSSDAVTQSNPGKPQPRRHVRELEGAPLTCSTQHEVELGPSGRSFLPGLSTSHIPTVRSHRTRSIQHYHPHSNELANPNRATAKKNKESRRPKLSQLHATIFSRICIDLYWCACTSASRSSCHEIAKLLSRWRITVIQDGAEFCIWWIYRICLAVCPVCTGTLGPQGLAKY